MFGIKALTREVEELQAQVRQLRVDVSQLLGMDAVAKLVEIGADAAKLDTTPCTQIDMDPDDMERHRALLQTRGAARVQELVKEQEALGAWARRGAERDD